MDDHAITNRKVASLAPTWRPWRGVSVLFDNPGASPGRRLEDATGAGIPQQQLYDDLTALVDAAQPAALRTAFGFCPLPRSTYHMTVCDGPNEVDLTHAQGPGVAAVAPVVDALPDSLGQVADAMDFAQVVGLLRAVEQRPVTFAAAEIVIWGSVLAARMVAADDTAHSALAEITAPREAVVEALRVTLGITVRPWRPHVSLGYFANVEGAGQAASTLAEWNERLASREPAVITYRSAALYGFTDMVSFLRASA